MNPIQKLIAVFGHADIKTSDRNDMTPTKYNTYRTAKYDLWYVVSYSLRQWSELIVIFVRHTHHNNYCQFSEMSQAGTPSKYMNKSYLLLFICFHCISLNSRKCGSYHPRDLLSPLIIVKHMSLPQELKSIFDCNQFDIWPIFGPISIYFNSQWAFRLCCLSLPIFRSHI